MGRITEVKNIQKHRREVQRIAKVLTPINAPQEHKEVCFPYAWKEIKLPEEIQV